MISTLGGLFKLDNLDQSSGANDVIVIRHKDGSLHSMPFNVRFGRRKIWNSANKVVQVEVNGRLTAAVMKIGSGGEAYWLQPTYGRVSEYAAADAVHANPLASQDAQLGEVHAPASQSASSAADPSLSAAARGGGTAVSDSLCSDTNAAHRQPSGVSHEEQTPQLPVAPRTPAQAATEDGDDSFAQRHLAASAGGGLHSMKAIQEAQLTLHAMHAAEKAERRLSRFLPHVDPYLWRKAHQEQHASATGRSQPGSPRDAVPSAEAQEVPEATPPVTGEAKDATAWQASSNPAATVAAPSVVGAAPSEVRHKPELPVDAPVAGLHSTASLSPTERSDAQAHDADSDNLGYGSGDDEYYLDPLDADDVMGGDSAAPGDFPNHSFSSSLTSGIGEADVAPLTPQGGHLLQPVNAPATAEEGDCSSAGETGGSTAVKVPPLDVRPHEMEGVSAKQDALALMSPTRQTYFTRSLIPSAADVLKLGLRDGCNAVRFIARKSYGSEVAIVACNIFLWDYADRLVVSDIDGTITKSDIWGHLYAMVGKGAEWTHPGICSLYSKVAANGYRMVYLSARSVSQIIRTKEYLWGLEQGGVGLPVGPVLTAPQRFFSALTQEVSKQSHVFKIACLNSVRAAFPASRQRPFFAGFGNRYGDVISYDAVHIPTHKIFIIDPTSVLHVCQVRQTYHNLADLVDATFPPVQHMHTSSHRYAAPPASGSTEADSSLSRSPVEANTSVQSEDGSSCSVHSDEELGPSSREPHWAAFRMQGGDLNMDTATAAGDRCQALQIAVGGHAKDAAAGAREGGSGTVPAAAMMLSSSAPGSKSAGAVTSPGRQLVQEPSVPISEDISPDADFGSFIFWRSNPQDLISAPPSAAAEAVAVPMTAPENHAQRGAAERGPGAGPHQQPSAAFNAPTSATSTPQQPRTSVASATAAVASQNSFRRRLFSFGFSRGRREEADRLSRANEGSARAHQHPDYANYAAPLTLAESTIEAAAAAPSKAVPPAPAPQKSPERSWGLWRRAPRAAVEPPVAHADPEPGATSTSSEPCAASVDEPAAATQSTAAAVPGVTAKRP